MAMDYFTYAPANNAGVPLCMRVKHHAARRSRIIFRDLRNRFRSHQLSYVAGLVLVALLALAGRSFLFAHTLLGGPPDWSEVRAYEAALPQHNVNLTFPEGASGRYVKFSCQTEQLGWNNVLNEVLMNAHLAYASKRAYVFQDYIWKREYYPWQQRRYLRKPRHTPLNALISGPAAGGEWEAGDAAPRSVSEAYWEQVCPPSSRRIINTREIKEKMYWDSGDAIFAAWRDLLLRTPQHCVEVVSETRDKDGFPQVFDLFLWGSDRILSLYDTFIRSPVSRLHATSPVVESAVARNVHLFRPRTKGVAPDPFARTLAMHVRRGDYKNACLNLAAWNSTFYSWNLLPALPDRFTAHAGGGWGWNTQENTALYLERCLPSLDAIVRKARDAKHDYLAEGAKKNETRALDVIYILTNDKDSWLGDLKAALTKDGWGTVITTKDLYYTQETLEVSMAVDMELARLAAVFIGNGWSSFTSNIVHRRLVDEREYISTRFF